MHYDLLVIGNSPAGRAGALTAAALNKRAALVDHSGRSDAAPCLDASADFAAMARRARSDLTQTAPRQRHSKQRSDAHALSMHVLRSECDANVRRDRTVAREQLVRSGVDWLPGLAQFVAPHAVEVDDLGRRTILEADSILIAVGTRPVRLGHIPFDGTHLLVPQELLALEHRPRSMIVVGAGAAGLDCAVLGGMLGAQTTVVERKTQDFCESDGASMHAARSIGAALRFGEEVIGAERSTQTGVCLHLHNGRELAAEVAVFCVGRAGNTEHLELQAAGIEPDERGRLWCNENLQTWTPHIYAAGDVVGFPAMNDGPEEQARRAMVHALGRAFQPSSPIARPAKIAPIERKIPIAV